MASKKSSDKISLFQWGDSVGYHKVDMMTPDNESEYDIFMMNRYLSMHRDFTPIMDLANSVDFRDKYMHYQFLLHCIAKPSRKPFIKFIKAEKPSDELKMVAKYFEVNLQVAETYMKRLTPENLEEIRERLNPETGGVRGKVERVKKK